MSYIGNVQDGTRRFLATHPELGTILGAGVAKCRELDEQVLDQFLQQTGTRLGPRDMNLLEADWFATDRVFGYLTPRVGSCMAWDWTDIKVSVGHIPRSALRFADVSVAIQGGRCLTFKVNRHAASAIAEIVRSIPSGRSPSAAPRDGLDPVVADVARLAVRVWHDDFGELTEFLAAEIAETLPDGTSFDQRLMLEATASAAAVRSVLEAQPSASSEGLFNEQFHIAQQQASRGYRQQVVVALFIARCVAISLMLAALGQETESDEVMALLQAHLKNVTEATDE